MKHHIIIARFNENISWINKIDLNLFDIFIYNKGPELECNKLYNVINIPNIGRETHTYLYHIIANYNALPEILIFTQGNPFDHVSDDFINTINKIQCKSFKFLSKSILTLQYNNTEDVVFEYGFLNNQFWADKHPITHSFYIVLNSLSNYTNITLDKNDIITLFGTGAIFAVNKTLIINKTKDFYLHCIEFFNTNDNLICPVEGHAFERFWYYIFTNLKNQ